MPLVLYDTLSRRKVRSTRSSPAAPASTSADPRCTPSRTSATHAGPVVFDVLRRWLEHGGIAVRLVMNVTDVGHLTDDADEGEDKLARRAALERLEPMEVAEKYFWIYFDAMARLGVRRPSVVPRATGHIVEQIELTQELLARGLAYEVDGSVYFDVKPGMPTASCRAAIPTIRSRARASRSGATSATRATSPCGSGRSPAT
jgi:cysteinyl-tRNA synthetase